MWGLGRVRVIGRVRVDGGSGARNGGLGRGMGHGDGAWRRCRTVRGRSAGAGTGRRSRDRTAEQGVGRRSRGRAAEREKTGGKKNPERIVRSGFVFFLGGGAAVKVER